MAAAAPGVIEGDRNPRGGTDFLVAQLQTCRSAAFEHPVQLDLLLDDRIDDEVGVEGVDLGGIFMPDGGRSAPRKEFSCSGEIEVLVEQLEGVLAYGQVFEVVAGLEVIELDPLLGAIIFLVCQR